jgi:hypothetical protein
MNEYVFFSFVIAPIISLFEVLLPHYISLVTQKVVTILDYTMENPGKVDPLLSLSPSSRFRELLSKKKGMKTHLWGRHPYLYSEEAGELVRILIEWPNPHIRPTIKDIPSLVSIFHSICFFFIISFVGRLSLLENTGKLKLKL